MGNETPLKSLPRTYPFLDLFLGAYIDAALWSSTDDEMQPLDRRFTMQDFAPETITRMESDCLLFYTRGNVESFTNGDLRIAGHDFWLTRNHHGAGFWDGDWPEPQSTDLTLLAHAFKECTLYIGDDGKLYLDAFGLNENHTDNAAITVQ